VALGSTEPTDHTLAPDYREKAVDNVRQMKRLLCHECPAMHDKVVRRRLFLAAFLKALFPLRLVSLCRAGHRVRKTQTI
jgi:hypothetical protein